MIGIGVDEQKVLLLLGGAVLRDPFIGGCLYVRYQIIAEVVYCRMVK